MKYSQQILKNLAESHCGHAKVLVKHLVNFIQHPYKKEDLESSLDLARPLTLQLTISFYILGLFFQITFQFPVLVIQGPERVFQKTKWKLTVAQVPVVSVSFLMKVNHFFSLLFGF